MKKLMIVLALGTMMVSCGGGDEAAKNIKVADLKDACGCAEAAVQVMEAIVPHMDEMKKIEDEKEGKAYLEKHGLGDLEKKMEEIEEHCKDFEEPGDDCAAVKKAEELMKKMK